MASRRCGAQQHRRAAGSRRSRQNSARAGVHRTMSSTVVGANQYNSLSGDLMKRRVFSLLAFAVFTVAAWAQASEWQIDPAHTTTGFTVRHMGISNVHGRFVKTSGSATIDDNDITKSSVNATMDVNSIDTG